MANKICRINGTYEFPIDFMSERASYNEVTKKYEPVLRFQTPLSEGNNFIFDLIPYMGITITSIEICDTETKESVVMSSTYDTIIDASTNFPQNTSEEDYHGQVMFSSSTYAQVN